VSFLTGWETASIKAEDHGVSNYTYRINATDGNMGVFYACEAYISEA
jgi:carbonic anhydrase